MSVSCPVGSRHGGGRSDERGADEQTRTQPDRHPGASGERPPNCCGLASARSTACSGAFARTGQLGSLTAGAAAPPTIVCRTFTLAAEKLEERHALRISRETLRTWMIQAGLWLPRAERKRFHQPRHRREHLGELIQIDGCEHRWFEDRGPPCTLLVFVDDAISRLVALGFVPSESAFAYFEVLQRYLETHGKPVAFYSDKHSIFRVSKAEAAGGDGMTQFGRALAELNTEIICANSSQAKGRVERAHATLQDRLVKELWLAGISDREAANAFLPGFIARYNSKFARPPMRDQDLHRPLEGMNDLGDILCWRETRRVSRQLMVHYNRMKFTLHPTEITARLVGQRVEIYDFPDGRLEIRWRGLPLAYAVFDKLQRVEHAAIVENKRLGEVLAWIKERQDARPVPSGLGAGPRRASQKAGLMKDRADRLAQVAQSQPKPERLAVGAPIGQSARRRPRLRLTRPD
jgi:hypothetical protein